MIGAVLLIALLYWKVVYTPIQEQLAQYDTSTLDTQIMQEQIKASRIKEMQEAIQNNEALSVGEIATYDNLTNEINELNSIVAGTTSYNFEFEDPYCQGTTVRRNILLTFRASNYQEAESVIKQLYGCRYRLLIGDLSLAGESEPSSLQAGPVQASVSMTFLETTVGADDLSGLMMMDESGNLVTQEEYQKEQAQEDVQSESETETDQE